MKILILFEKNPFVKNSAASNRFLSLAEGLLDCGAKLKLIFIAEFGSDSEKREFGKRGVYRGYEYEYIFPFKSGIVFYKLIKLFYTPSVISKIIYSKIKRDEYDYLWIGASGVIIKIMLKLLKLRPNVNIFHERSEFSWIGFSTDKKLHDQYLQKILPSVDVFSVMTLTLSKYYSQFISEKTAMIHLPMTVDLSRFSGEIKISEFKKPYIGYIGAMNNSKDGVDILINAFVEIMNEFPSLQLYLIGPQDPKEDYLIQKEIIDQHNASDRITYVGNLSRDLIPPFLRNSTVLALARPNSKQAEGGFPTKLGEYLASGKPVCITKVGEIGDYLVDNESAFFAEPGSYISFANTIRRALTSQNASKIGEAGKHVAISVFNKDIQSKRLYDFLLSNK